MTGWLIALLILLVILLLPVGVWVRYDDGDLLVRAAAGPLRIKVFPPKEKTEAQRLKQEEKKRKKQEKQKQAKKKTTQKTAKEIKAEKKAAKAKLPKKKFSPEQLTPYVRLALKVLGKFPRKFQLRELTVHVTFGGANAAETAINYGRAWAAIGAILPVLENHFRIRKQELDAKLDYAADKLKLFLQLDLRLRIGPVLLLMLCAGVQFLIIFVQNKKKGGANE